MLFQPSTIYVTYGSRLLLIRPHESHFFSTILATVRTTRKNASGDQKRRGRKREKRGRSDKRVEEGAHISVLVSLFT